MGIFNFDLTMSAFYNATMLFSIYSKFVGSLKIIMLDSDMKVFKQ